MSNGQPPRRPPPPLANVRPGNSERSVPQRPRPGPARPGKPPQQPAPRGSLMGAALVTIAIGLLVVGAVGVAAFVLAPSADSIKRQAIAEVKKQTGRDLAISGPISLAFYPSAGVTLSDVTLSAPPGMGGAPTIKIAKLDIGVELLPLLGSRVAVNRFVLTRPHFDLRVDSKGQRSWNFAEASPRRVQLAAADRSTLSDASPAGAPIAVAQAGAPRAPALQAHGFALDDLKLQDVRIVDGRVDYTDERGGIAERITSLDVELSADRISRPLKAKGDLNWKGETVAFDGTLTSLSDILSTRAAKVAGRVEARPLKASYQGSLDLAGETSLDGTVSANSPSLRALAAWAGSPLAGQNGFGAISLTGRLVVTPRAAALENADITLDGVKAVGRIAAEDGKTRPKITADLKLTSLDLNPYMDAFSGHQPAGAKPTTAPSLRGTAPPPAGNAAPASPRSIEDLLERQPAGPRVRGYSQRAGWSDARIDLSPLGQADADARLEVEALRIGEIKIGAAQVRLSLDNRIANVTFERVALYGGNGRGLVTVDGAAAAPHFEARLVAEDIDVAGLLDDAADIGWLAGKGRLSVAVTGSGRSEKEIVTSLSGRSETQMANGAIKGINLARILRALSQGQIGELDAAPEEKTDFSSMSASFDIDRGIATNTDMQLLSPLLRVSGDGRVLLPDRQLDYTLKPKVVATLEGEGGTSALDGLEVPVRISGEWSSPSITPDLSKIDLGQAARAVEEIGKSLKGKSSDQIVDDLLGKDTDGARKAKKFLDKLFR